MAYPIELSSITDEDLLGDILEECSARAKKTQMCPDPELIECFDVTDDLVYLPLGTWETFVDKLPPPPKKQPRTRVRCTKELFTKETDPKGKGRDQNIVFAQALEKLKRDKTVFLALHTGFGKTSMGNYFTGYLKRKTAVLCHISKVCEQWVEEYQLYSTARVQLVKGSKMKLDPKADVYVFSILSTSRRTREELSEIGLVIIDESHIATVTAFSKTLLLFQPQYLIGLSATPYRPDGLGKLLEIYFGSKKEFIVRKEVKPFTVYKVLTPFVPKIEYTLFMGKRKLNYAKAINSICYNEDRQKLVVDMITERHPPSSGDRIMVLSDRNEECINISELLKKSELEEKEPRLLIGTTKKDAPSDFDYRILIAGVKKGGVGFNDPDLTVLFLLYDCQDVTQYEGRIRTKDCHIYVFVDNYGMFENHWKKQEPWFLERGATIEVINLRGSAGISTSTQREVLCTGKRLV